MLRYEQSDRRASARHARASLPCLLLALGCGQRFELGQLEQNVENDGPPTSVESIGVKIVSTGSDVDATLGAILDQYQPRRRVSEVALLDFVGLGDVDGDGFADLGVDHSVALAPAESGSALRIVYGGPRPEEGILAADQFASLTLLKRNIELFETSAAGDVNGDGYADVFVASAESYYGQDAVPALQYATADRPKAYLLYGGPERLPASALLPIAEQAVTFADPDDLGGSLEPSVRFRKCVRLTPLGDLDGDGFDDFAQTTFTVGINPDDDQDQAPPLYETVTYLHYGRAESFTSDPGSQQPAAKLLDVGSLATIGDANGDGHADLLVSGHGLHVLPGSARRLSGEVSIDAQGVPVIGDLSLRSGDLVLPITGELARQDDGPRFDTRLGDLDGDGFDDVLLSGAIDFIDNFNVDGPYAHVFYGRADFFARPLVLDEADATFDTRLSGAVHAVADWNADGYADLVYERTTWAPVYEGTPDSTLFLVPGGPVRLSGGYQSALTHDEASDEDALDLLTQLVSPGDLDADGHADLVFLKFENGKGDHVGIEYGRADDVPAIR
jgi:hypothetical protein